jgi:hypothetical protein
MSAIENLEPPATAVAAPPRWPLFAAPFAGLAYYLVLLLAFLDAMGKVVDTTDVAVPGLSWGHHWLYHIFAVGLSVSFGTFVAAGVARERAAIGGLLGGFGITLLLSARLLVIGMSVSYDGAESIDPLYQHIISAAAAIAAPIIGFHLGRAIRDISIVEPSGFSGIPRAHFLWLWLPVFYYGKSIIGPLVKYLLAYFLGSDGREIAVLDTSVMTGIMYFVVCVVPVVVYAIPLFIGLGLLSGRIGNTSTSAKRTVSRIQGILGAVVLVVGWFMATTMQYGILISVDWLVG